VYAAGLVASLFLVGHVSDWVRTPSGPHPCSPDGPRLPPSSSPSPPRYRPLLTGRVLTGVALGAAIATASAYLTEPRLRSGRRSDPAVADREPRCQRGRPGPWPALRRLVATYVPQAPKLPYEVFAALLVLGHSSLRRRPKAAQPLYVARGTTHNVSRLRPMHAPSSMPPSSVRSRVHSLRSVRRPRWRIPRGTSASSVTPLGRSCGVHVVRGRGTHPNQHHELAPSPAPCPRAAGTASGSWRCRDRRLGEPAELGAVPCWCRPRRRRERIHLPRHVCDRPQHVIRQQPRGRAGVVLRSRLRRPLSPGRRRRLALQHTDFKTTLLVLSVAVYAGTLLASRFPAAHPTHSCRDGPHPPRRSRPEPPFNPRPGRRCEAGNHHPIPPNGRPAS
jgi:hypothetical protein